MKNRISLPHEVEEQLEEHLRSKKPLFGKDSPWSGLLQTMVNSILEGELSHHLSEERKQKEIGDSKNKRNGHIHKEILSDNGPLLISTPRDRNGTFEPEIVQKRQRQLTSGLDNQIMALYAQGNSVEDVRRLLLEMYNVELSAGKISQITDSILPEIASWRTRPLKSFYAIVYMDAIHFKVRSDGKYKTQAFYTVYAIDWEGNRDLLGMYVNESEAASRWGMVLNDLKERGVEDILYICIDNLTGFSDVIQDVFPQTIIQKCIVHQIRNSLKFVLDKDKKKVAKALRKIYTASTLYSAEEALKVFDNEWGTTYGYITKQWRNNWDELTPYFNHTENIRRMIYTTNPVEALHRIIRKLVKSKAAWVSQEALTKQIYLSLMQNKKSWKKRTNNWKSIQLELLEQYSNRITPHLV